MFLVLSPPSVILLGTLRGKTIVNYFTWNTALALDDRTLKPLDKLHIIAPTTLVEQILTYAFRADDAKLILKDIYSYATSVNTCQIINGKDVVTPYRLPTLDLYYLTRALYIYTYSEKWRSGKVDQKLIDLEKASRDFPKRSLMSKIFSPFLATDRRSAFTNLMTMDWVWMDDLHLRLYRWKCNPDLYGISIEKSVWFTTHEDVSKTTVLLNNLHAYISEGKFTIAK